MHEGCGERVICQGYNKFGAEGARALAPSLIRMTAMQKLFLVSAHRERKEIFCTDNIYRRATISVEIALEFWGLPCCKLNVWM